MKSIIIALLLLSFCYTNGQNETHVYFKHLVFRETPYAPTKGRIAITKEKATKENHYRLTYDNLNRLIKVAYRYSDKLIQIRRFGMLDGNRNLMPKTLIKYEDGKEIRIFFDENGIQRNNFMGLYKEVYTFDLNNKRTGLKFYDKENNPVNNSWKIFEYLWSHPNTTDVLEKRKNTKGEYAFMRSYYKFMTTLYKYTENGILISMNNVDENNKLIEEETGVAVDVPKYDENLNMISYRFYNAKKEPVVGTFIGAAGGEVTYDDNGNVLEYRTVGLNGKPMIGKRPYVFRRFVFDTYGNFIKRAFYGINNELIPVNNITVIAYKYSDKDPSKLFKSEFYHTTLKE